MTPESYVEKCFCCGEWTVGVNCASCSVIACEFCGYCLHCCDCYLDYDYDDEY